MSTIKTLLSVTGLLIVGAAGCAQPGVIEQHPVTTKRDAGAKKDAKVDTSVDNVGTDEDEDEDKPTDDGEEDKPTDDGDEPVDEDDGEPVAMTKDAGAPKDAGGGNPGTSKDAGPAKDAGGGTTKPAAAACPSPYTCQDPAKSITDLGLDGTVTDADGKPLSFACANGMQETCDPKDPKKSCPNFPNAFCAHVKIMGLVSADLYNCAQLCTP